MWKYSPFYAKLTTYFALWQFATKVIDMIYSTPTLNKIICISASFKL